MRASIHIVWLAVGLIASWTGPARGAPYDLLYEHPMGLDEDSRFATFLGHGVVMLGEGGRTDPREARVFSAWSGRLERVLECPPIYLDDDQRCPTAVAASPRLFALLGTHALHVFTRDGQLLYDIAPPPGFPSGYFAHALGMAVRGRRIAVGGPAYEDGARAPGVAVHVFDGFTGALLDQHRIAAPQGYVTVSVAFAGRALVAGMPGDWPVFEPGRVAAIDSRTGALWWSRNAPAPATGDQFGRQLAVLGSDVIVGAYRLDGRTGELKQSYPNPEGGPYSAYGDVAASRGRVAVANGRSLVHVFSADDGVLLETIEPPFEMCDTFGKTLDISVSRLLVTVGSYCGPGQAFVFRVP